MAILKIRRSFGKLKSVFQGVITEAKLKKDQGGIEAVHRQRRRVYGNILLKDQ
jgi:hypothetical protein